MRLIYLTLAWSAGILLAASPELRATAIWLTVTVAAVSLFTLLSIALRTSKRRTGNAGRRGLLLLAVFGLGGLRLSLAPITSDVAAYADASGLTLEGIVTAEPAASDDRIELRLNAETATRGGTTVATAGIVVVQTSQPMIIRYGDRIQATGQLLPAESTAAPSYRDARSREGVFAEMPNAAVVIVAHDQGNPLYAALLNLKQQARSAIARALPEPQAGLLTGILLGDERGIAPETEEAFAATGAAHIVAISGFNMVILGELVRKTLAHVRIDRRTAAFASAGFIAVYTVFVGASPAIVRAALMAILLVVGNQLRRRTFVPASIALAVLLLSAINPTVLWDISFQLSAAATLGLALFAEPIQRAYDRFVERTAMPFRRLGRFLAPSLTTTVAAQITVTPLLILYFGRLSPLILPVNLLILPVQPLLLGLGALATVVSFLFMPAAQALYGLTHVLLVWTIGIVRLFAAIPANIDPGVHPALLNGYLGMVVAGGTLATARPEWSLRLSAFARRRIVVYAILGAGLMVVALMGLIITSRPDGRLHVWFLDTGPGNGVLVQTPGGAHILIDGGRSPSRLLTAIGDRLPFHKRVIDVWIMTQPDPFDVGALPALLSRYGVSLAVSNGQPSLDPVMNEINRGFQAGFAETDAVTVSTGYTLDFSDGTRLDVLNPSETPVLGDSFDTNGLVTRVTLGDISFLLTGDLSVRGQSELMAAGAWPLATVLQLPQHGTIRSLSPEFLAAAQPQVAILQVERSNRRGDPNPDTLAQLGTIPLFRTDEGGAIHVATDGRELWVTEEQ